MDSGELAKRVRLDQTRHELQFLKSGINEWLTRRNDKDVDNQNRRVHRHKTQLDTLESILIEALDELIKHVKDLEVNGIPAEPPNDSSPAPMPQNPLLSVGEFYTVCREYDDAVIWVQRLWEYFKEKFDQRDDPRTGRLLKAADEVVWSCYRSVFAALNKKPGPAPLSYIEPEYSPAAVQADQRLPARLRLKADVDFLDKFLKTMPVPIVRLPPWCIDAPWWLIYLAHEVGHHIQHSFDLIDHFRQGLQRAASEMGLSDTDATLWGDWGEEIFADVFSIAAMGSPAVRAVVEAEQSAAPDMVKRKGTYPAPAIRLALMSRVADELRMNGAAQLGGLDLNEMTGEQPDVSSDMKVVEGAVKFALGPLPNGLGTLPKWFGVQRDAGQNDVASQREKDVRIWAQSLSTQSNTLTERELRTGRQWASGALLAWADVAQLSDADERRTKMRLIAENTKDALIRCAPAGTRAGPDGKMPGKGRELANGLLSALRQRLPDRSS